MVRGAAARLAAIGAAALLCLAAPLAAQEEVGRGPVTNLPLPRYVSLRADTANARRGPGLDHRVDWEFVRRGLPVEVTAEYGHWRRVRDADGVGGWVHHTLLSGVRTAIVRGPEVTPLLAKPRGDAAVRAMAEPGVVARVVACEGDWCEVKAGPADGWLRREAIWGVSPDEVID